jgi:hypothetical protein
MTLNYRVVVERHPFTNGVVGDSVHDVKSSLYFTGKLARYMCKPIAHPPKGWH